VAVGVVVAVVAEGADGVAAGAVVAAEAVVVAAGPLGESGFANRLIPASYEVT